MEVKDIVGVPLQIGMYVAANYNPAYMHLKIFKIVKFGDKKLVLEFPDGSRLHRYPTQVCAIDPKYAVFYALSL